MFRVDRYLTTAGQNSAAGQSIAIQTMDISMYDQLSFGFVNQNSSGTPILAITLSFSNDLSNASAGSGTPANFVSANTSSIPYPSGVAGTASVYTSAILNAYKWAQVSIRVTSCFNAGDLKVLVAGFERVTS